MTNGTTQASGKKILVVYYSLTGSTARVARDIAARAGADVESIRDRGHGVGFFRSFKNVLDAMRRIPAKIGPLAKNPGDYALTIVGTPVWAGKVTPAVRAYLLQTQGRLGSVAFFVTSGNTDVARIAPSMEQLGHAKAVASTGFNAQELKEQNVYEEKLASFLKDIHLPYNSPKTPIGAPEYAMRRDAAATSAS